jgi:hypothetical protein
VNGRLSFVKIDPEEFEVEVIEAMETTPARVNLVMLIEVFPIRECIERQ